MQFTIAIKAWKPRLAWWCVDMPHGVVVCGLVVSLWVVKVATWGDQRGGGVLGVCTYIYPFRKSKLVGKL